MDGALIGERVKAARQRQRWSQRMLAYKAGVSHAYVSHLEAGGIPRPGAAMVGKIAGALGTTVQDLLGDAALIDVSSLNINPDIEEIRVNLAVLEDLNPSSLGYLKEIVVALKEKAEREHRIRIRLERHEQRKVEDE